MTGLPFLGSVPLVWGLGLALLLAIATLVGARLLARGSTRPLEVRVTGQVPPVSDWLPEVIKKYAAASSGSSAHFTDVMDGPILRGHRAQLSLPATGVEFELRTQPHLVLEQRPSTHPLVINLDMVEFPRRKGLSGLIYGPIPAKDALAARSSLQKAITRDARDRGLSAQAPRPSSGRGVVVIGAVLTLVVLLATGAGVFARWQLRTSAPWFPAGATECPVPTESSGKTATKSPGKAPTRMAVTKGTSCGFAKTVRAAYLKADTGTSPVKLGKLKYNKKTKLAVTCTVGTPIVCKGPAAKSGQKSKTSQKIVYLG